MILTTKLFTIKTWAILFLCPISRIQCKSAFGYHVSVGIPRVAELKLSEWTPRIVGGSQVNEHAAFPYQAGIIVTLANGLTSICGGALISRTRVLTAAHCWWDGQNQARKFTIVLGSTKIFSGGRRIDTTDVVIHPSWNTNDITHDIAIVKISSVALNSEIQPIPLPNMSDVNVNFAGLTGTASGYGKTRDTQNSFPTTTSLYHVSVPIITNAECQKSFEMPIHGSHLCTSGVGGKGTCDGDSGGPLTVVQRNQRTLVGVVSFGLGNGCQRGYPSVYTRVTAFLTWINANL